MFVRRAGQLIRSGRYTLSPALTQTASFCDKNDDRSSDSNNDSSSDEEKAYIDDIKHKILTASMEFVNEEGWTKEALGRGAKSIGYASAVHTIFPHGPAHLVLFFTSNCNTQLAELMKKQVADIPAGQLNPVKFIEDAIMTRIEMLDPYKSNWSYAIAASVNSKLAMKQIGELLRMTDDICYFAGDRSVNSIWYARRAVVATIYQGSELHWLGGGKNTREFTASQVAFAANLEEVPRNISALLTIACNLAPINFNR